MYPDELQRLTVTFGMFGKMSAYFPSHCNKERIEEMDLLGFTIFSRKKQCVRSADPCEVAANKMSLVFLVRSPDEQ